MLVPELDKRGYQATILKLAGPLASNAKAKGCVCGQAGVLRFNHQKRKNDYHGLRNDVSVLTGSAVTAGPGANYPNTFSNLSAPDVAQLRKRGLFARGPAMCVRMFWPFWCRHRVPCLALA
jgi:hypothetical protein